jgi:hypothetical protein
MINVVHLEKCVHENCKLTPLFNYAGEEKGLYCSKHKLENMIDLKHKICIENNCILRAYYNIYG